MTVQPERASARADFLSAIVLMAAVAFSGGALVKAVSSVDVLSGVACAFGIGASALGGGLDLARRRVPNALTLTLWAIGLALAVARLASGRWGLGDFAGVFVAWAVCLLAWGLRLFGGGDAKLAMGLLGLFPTTGVALGLLVGLLTGGLVYLAFEPDRAGWSRLKRVVSTIWGARALPARGEVADSYRRRAHPAAAWIGAGFCLSMAFGLLGSLA